MVVALHKQFLNDDLAVAGLTMTCLDLDMRLDVVFDTDFIDQT